ncbi:endolytic transglycosylase MltG [Bacillaceae bacterium Marseille-Q3522]|nr:endolytic transglycosylase MltG [Bacillaceae bacterium Marseille-Q3522]
MSDDVRSTKKQIISEKILEKHQEAKIVRRIVFTIALLFFIIAAVIGTGGYLYINSALKPVDEANGTEKNITIPIGSSVTTISRILEDEGIIKDARVFRYYVKFKNETDFMAGDYKMDTAMTFPEIIETLKTGKIVQEVLSKITIPEGKQLVDIAKIIAEKTDHKEEDIFARLNDPSFIADLMGKYPTLLTNDILNENIKYPLEGYLFPATYSFYVENPTLEEIVYAMLNKSEEVIESYLSLMEEKQYSVHTLLTMASLIEQEATEQGDRDMISSVFHNRLAIDMPLQTDPTVLYAQGEHQAKTLYEDLEIDSPYNTYKYTGLTPGPIANAGVSSIEAALNPAQSDYLYFLATPTGEILFSQTLEEHNAKKAEHLTNP